MTQFYFQQNAAAGGSGSISSPWDQAAFNAALASGAFKIGGADQLAIIFNNTNGGTSTLSISAANANNTLITGIGGDTQVNLTSTILTGPSTNLTGIAATAPNALAIRNNLGVAYFSVPTGSALTLNAAQASGLAITGFGSTTVNNLQASLAANLTGIATSTANANFSLTSNQTFTGKLGTTAANITGSGVLTINNTTNDLQALGGRITVGNGATLRTTAAGVAQLNGVVATTTGSGIISLADLDSNAGANLSGLTGNVQAVVASNTTFRGNLGTINPTVNAGFRLTLDSNADTVVNRAQFNGSGSVTYQDAVAGTTALSLNVFTAGTNLLTTVKTGNNVVNTGSGADTITLAAGNDSVTSGAGNDSITTNAGNDVIRAGAGVDTIRSGDGADYIEAGGGNDSVDGGDGENYITDSQGQDTITTGTGSDTILSGDLNDSITSGAGADSIGAGSGNDIVNAEAANDTVVGGGGADTINGGADTDNLSGGDGNDQFLVAANGQQVAADVIAGGTGTNTIGFTGAAAVSAEIDFDNVSDVLTINNAGDNLGETRALTFSAITEATVQTVVADFNNSTAAVTVTNNAASSTTSFNITSGSSTDNLSGSNGADTLTGGAGNDILNAGAGIDSVSGGGDNDTILVAGAGQQVAGDIINAGAGVNLIRFTGAAAVTAEFDFDNITDVLAINNAGDNLAFGRNVTFSAITETAAQTVVFDLANSTAGVSVTNNAASSTTLFNLTGGNQTDTLAGSSGNDTINGGLDAAVADNLSGGDGNDRFDYTITNEFIAGETVNGGAGTDTILFTIDAQTVADAAFTNKTLIEAITTANGTNSFTLAAIAAAATANLTVTGGIDDDTINASALGESINIVGNAGNNTLTGTNQVDTITAGGGNDVITGGALADNLSGGAGTNRFQYGDAEFITAETVTGGAGADTILFTANGQTVADTAFANKTLLEAFTTGNGVNSITLGAIAGGAFATITVTGGSGIDTINATDLARNATIFGGDGNDVLTGSSQADQFTGSNGNDQLAGGAGIDTFRYGANGGNALASAAANGADAITGFVAGAGGDIAAFNVAIDGGTALTGGIAALGAVQTTNPGGAQNNAINTYIRLVDIAGNQDITTAGGLQTALAGGGEYANVLAAAAGNFIIVTAATNATQAMNVFYGNAAVAGAIGNITSLGTIALNGADTINTLAAGNFA